MTKDTNICRRYRPDASHETIKTERLRGQAFRCKKVPCPLSETPFSCEARVVHVFNVAEYGDPQRRYAALKFGHDLGWCDRKWLSNLLTELAKLDAHWTDATGRIFDLDLSCFETETDDNACEHEDRDSDVLRCWFRDTYGPEPDIEALPAFSDIGKRRFMIVTSILLAAYPELEAELIRLSNAEHPVEDEDRGA